MQPLAPENPVMQIGNFTDMQLRYHTLPLANRARAVMCDAEMAFAVVTRILEDLKKQPELTSALAALRKNTVLISRIRPCEAKTALMDDSVSFIKLSSRKLASWQKMLQNIAQGTTQATIMKEDSHCTITGVSAYLAIVKLIVAELIKFDKPGQTAADTMTSELRRCITILSDCECASEFNRLVLH